MNNETDTGLVYFKPAGVVMRRASLAARVLECPVTVEVEHRASIVFPEESPVPLIAVDTEVRLEVGFTLLREKGAPERSTIGEFAIFSEAGEPKINFNLPNPVVTTESDGDSKLRAVDVFPVTAVIGTHPSRDSIDNSFVLQMLKKVGADGRSLKKEEWWEKFGAVVAGYAKATQFVLEAENKLLTAAGEAAARSPLASMGDSLNDDEAPFGARPAIMPAVSREEVEAKRQVRQKRMGELRAFFEAHGRVVFKVPVSMIDQYPEVATPTYALLDQEGVEGSPAEVLAARVADLLAGTTVDV